MRDVKKVSRKNGHLLFFSRDCFHVTHDGLNKIGTSRSLKLGLPLWFLGKSLKIELETEYYNYVNFFC